MALDYAVHRLGEAVLERAIEGTATPIFYKGELVGERRRYDDRLAMFVLRMRDPERFGSWREDRIPVQHSDAEAIRLRVALMRVNRVARAQEKRSPRSRPEPDRRSAASDARAEGRVYRPAGRTRGGGGGRGQAPPMAGGGRMRDTGVGRGT